MLRIRILNILSSREDMKIFHVLNVINFWCYRINLFQIKNSKCFIDKQNVRQDVNRFLMVIGHDKIITEIITIKNEKFLVTILIKDDPSISVENAYFSATSG